MRSLRFFTPLLLILFILTALNHSAQPVHSHPSGRDSDQPTYRHFLPVVFKPAMTAPYDMTRFMIGDGRLYEVLHSGGSQARHQTQIEGERFYFTKGNEVKAEWEELWEHNGLIYRGTDTSPGDDQYYSLYENGVLGSAWSPRFWNVGDLFERHPYVVFYDKADCKMDVSGFQPSWLRFDAFYPTFTFASGITLNNVVKLSWLLTLASQPTESYYFAEFYGLVAWESVDAGSSHVSELHAPGTRPDNTREVIPCLSAASEMLRYSPELNFGPLPPGYRAK